MKFPLIMVLLFGTWQDAPTDEPRFLGAYKTEQLCAQEKALQESIYKTYHFYCKIYKARD